MGLPMTLQLLMFVWWSNLVLPNLDSDDGWKWSTQNSILQACLTVTAVYLVVIEISAIYRATYKYFTNVPRLLNLITPILIQTNVYNVNPTSMATSYFWTIQAWAAICIWFRFALFLGTLDTFGLLVRLIIRSFVDMW